MNVYDNDLWLKSFLNVEYQPPLVKRMHQYPIISNYYYFLMDWKSETTKNHIAEAKAVGLTLLGEGKTDHYRLYRFNGCSHKQEIQLGLVRKKSFRCAACFEAKLKKKTTNPDLTKVTKLHE